MRSDVPVDARSGRRGPLWTESRGVSTTVTYVLTLSITVLLVTGLLIGTSTLTEQRQESVAREELHVIGQHISSRVMAADRLASTGPTELAIRGDLPRTVAGDTYTVRVRNGTQPRLSLSAAEIDVTVEVPFAVRRPVVETAVPGGDLQITLTDAGELEVQSR